MKEEKRDAKRAERSECICLSISLHLQYLSFVHKIFLRLLTCLSYCHLCVPWSLYIPAMKIQPVNMLPYGACVALIQGNYKATQFYTG